MTAKATREMPRPFATSRVPALDFPPILCTTMTMSTTHISWKRRTPTDNIP